MKHIVIAFALMCFATSSAYAANAYTVKNSNVRVSPTTKSARVMVVPRGARVHIDQCVRGNRWCAVSWGNRGGWVHRSNLAFRQARRAYQGSATRYYDPYADIRPGYAIPSQEYSAAIGFDFSARLGITHSRRNRANHGDW